MKTERKLGRVDNGRKVTSLEKKTNQSIKERSKQVKVKDKGTEYNESLLGDDLHLS